MKTIEGIFYLDHTPVSIEVQDGRIHAITRKDKLSDPRQEQLYIAPGFIDNQVNGYASVSFVFGGGELTVEGVRQATQALWQEGVTTYLPTLTTSRHEVLLQNFAVLARARQQMDIGRSIPGYHLEGPYISPEDGYRGAHPREWVRPPDWDEFLAYYEAADRKILQVSLAPEVAGALAFMRKCRQQGIVVALAHHNGSAQVIKQAIDAGAAVATHLGNGCANSINRHANPLWPQLADDRLLASLVCDGFHLLPEQVQVFYRVKGPERIIITSDVTRFAGMKPGQYQMADGETIELTPDGMIRYPAQNVLAGAASPIAKGVGNIMRFTQCTLADAIHMASRNPARLYGFTDRGEIAVGKRADLILFDLKDGKLEIKQTIIAGDAVYCADDVKR